MTADTIAEPVRVYVYEPYGVDGWTYQLIGMRSGLVLAWGSEHPRPSGGWLPAEQEAIAAGRARAEEMGLEVRN